MNQTIVDVRTREEFAADHIPGSINIPLNEIPAHLDEFKTMANLVVCCLSGGRSGQAMMFLKQNGIECTNGGSFLAIKQQQQ